MLPIPAPGTDHSRHRSEISRTLLTLSSAFSDFYAGNAEHLSYYTLYSCAYNVVAADHGEVLYTQVATTIATEVEKLAASLYSAASASDAEFLRELLGSWKKHCDAISMINDVVMYMDRTFIQKRGKAPVPELGLRAWREGMLDGLDGEVPLRLQAALLGIAGRERAGEAVDVALYDLVASATKMLLELGDSVYQEFFETPFLDETRWFYSRESVRLLASPCTCGEYLRTVKSMVDVEMVRVSRCPDARTEEKVVAVVLTEMVEKNMARLVGMEGSVSRPCSSMADTPARSGRRAGDEELDGGSLPRDQEHGE
ncbi:hypothetical protein QYE76_046667 [Lolium multiflorum]|uniref:Cullin N-terminal domain-containing protein n=1 Tax=Lolium multiflorum TaxID=4521 RepID=A0AAD8WZD7_LOLMU|nr:hypothetical protein QYE76_046667 [Lolium multiflorum]